MGNTENAMRVLQVVSELFHLMLESENSYQKLKLKLGKEKEFTTEEIFEHIDEMKCKKLNFT
jgi:hypothetical protein